MIRPKFTVTLRIRQVDADAWEFSTIVGGITEGGVTSHRFVTGDVDTTEPVYLLCQDAFDELTHLWYQWFGALQGTLVVPQSWGQADTSG